MQGEDEAVDRCGSNPPMPLHTTVQSLLGLVDKMCR